MNQHKRIHWSPSAGFSLVQGLTGEEWRLQKLRAALAWSKLLCPNGAHFPPGHEKGLTCFVLTSIALLIMPWLSAYLASHPHQLLEGAPTSNSPRALPMITLRRVNVDWALPALRMELTAVGAYLPHNTMRDHLLLLTPLEFFLTFQFEINSELQKSFKISKRNPGLSFTHYSLQS